MNRAGTRLLLRIPTLSKNFTDRRLLCAVRPSSSPNSCKNEKAKNNSFPEQPKHDIKSSRLVQQFTSTFSTIKYYFKKHWYIAVPIHCVSCSLWFAGLYLAVRSGVDVVSTLEFLHIPESWIEKIKNTPASAGHFVVAAILYKIATPGRYATTLAGIQLAFWILGRRLR